MRDETSQQPGGDAPVIDVDHLVIGAGISGICAGHHLSKSRPGESFVILEGRERIGGTWDLFRYPGVRSDSDMFTLGYRFRPWSSDLGIAEGGAIRDYVEETAVEDGFRDRILLEHKVSAAAWNSDEARWRLSVETPDGPRVYRGRFLFVGAGYYNYDDAFTPNLPGRESYRGEILHPQFWPEGKSLAGKRVAVIGSGATAVTLVPAIAEEAGHVVMVQRTPSYIGAIPRRDAIAAWLQRKLPPKTAYKLTRWKNILRSMYLYRTSRKKPEGVRQYILKEARAKLPEGFDVEKHFSPPYDPWDQRFCLAPDGDLFAAIKRGKASVVTSAVTGFNERGLTLENGEEVEADVIVTATGLQLRMFGGIDVSVDGAPFKVPEAVTYKGAMLSGLPNAITFFGYINASWTLKCELVAAWAMRLLDHMKRNDIASATPRAPTDMALGQFMALSSGYVTRSADLLPKQGDREPWIAHQNYAKDIRVFRFGSVADEGLEMTAGAHARDKALESGSATAAAS